MFVKFLNEKLQVVSLFHRIKILLFAFVLILGITSDNHTSIAQDITEAEKLANPKEPRPILLADELRPTMKKELFLLFMVVEADEATKAEISKEAEASLFTMDDLIPNDFQGEGSGFSLSIKARTRSGRSLCANPYERIQTELTTIAKKHLRPSDCRKYDTELAAIRTTKRAANVALVLSIMDRYLALTEDKKTTIGNKLCTDWEDAINVDVVYYHQDNPQGLPKDIAHIVEPKLNANQVEIWSKIPKYHYPVQMHALQVDINWEES